MSYKILSLLNKQEWSDYLNKLPLDQQDVYYTPDYYALYENYGDGNACCFIFEKGGEIALYPFLINSINKLGYKLDKEYFDIQGAYGYNGVVSSSYDLDFIDDFYKIFQKYCEENNIIAEFTRFHPLLGNHFFSINHLGVLFDRYTVYVKVSKPEKELWSDIQRTSRKQINRCINRYQIRIDLLGDNNYDLNTFTKIYWDSMERVKSNKHLFFNIGYFEQILSLPNTIQYIVYINGKAISTIIAMKGKTILHGHLGGTLKEYLNISPFSVLYWEIIKTAKTENLNFVHVGGGNTTKKEDKLLMYKEHFSSLKSEFYIGNKIYNQTVYDKIALIWKTKHPKSFESNSNKILGYREL